MVDILPNVHYVYRQNAKDNNPKEVNSAVENTYFICPEDGIHKNNTNTNEGNMECMTNLPTSTLTSNINHWSSVETSAILEIVAHLLSEPLFDQLRTKEQLGYLVHNSASKIGNILTLRVIIQSNNSDPDALDEVYIFITNYY